MTDTGVADVVADNIPVLCWMANADGGIHWFNQAWYDYTGLTPEQSDGWGWRDAHDPDALPEVLIRWTAALANKRPFVTAFPLRAADGTYRPFLTKARPILDGNGRVRSWFGSSTDVSDLIDEDPDLQARLESLRRRRD